MDLNLGLENDFFILVKHMVPDINVHMFVRQLLDFLDDLNLAILPLPLLTSQASNIVFESIQDAFTKL